MAIATPPEICKLLRGAFHGIGCTRPARMMRVDLVLGWTPVPLFPLGCPILQRQVYQSS